MEGRSESVTIHVAHEKPRIINGGKPGEGGQLSAWVDADHSTCPDTRHSISGGVVMMGEGAISWFS